jgi:hypothetical protein
MQCHHLPLENRKLFDFLIGNPNLISTSLATMLPFEGLRAIFRLFRFSRSIGRLLRRLRFSQRNQGPDRGACCPFGIKPIDAACAIRPRDVQVRPLSPIGELADYQSANCGPCPSPSCVVDIRDIALILIFVLVECWKLP